MNVSERKVLTAQEYLEHCMEKKLVPEDAAGGFYKRIFIRDYLHVQTPIAQLIRDRYETPVVWPGVHKAPLIRASRSVGAVNHPALIPDKIKLFDLSILFFTEFPSQGFDGPMMRQNPGPLGQSIPPMIS